MLMSEKEYSDYINQTDNSYIRKNKTQLVLNDWFRVGCQTYVRPPASPFSSGFKYTVLPKKQSRFSLCLDNITNPKLNRTFRNKEVPSDFNFQISRLKQLPKTHQLMEIVIPFLMNDIELSKKFNHRFSNKEVIRGYFHMIFESYPNGYFDNEENLETIPLDMFADH